MKIVFFFLVLIFSNPKTASSKQIFPKNNHQKLCPYVIYRSSPGAGFWSNFFVILAGIDKADQQGWVPVIDMERHPTLYNETTPVCNVMNAWEYFFEQPAGVVLTEALKDTYLDNNGGCDGVFSRAITIQPPIEKIIRAKELILKYIKVKAHILNEVDALIPPGLHDTILGVHVRGTDRRQGAHNHLLTDSAEVYLEKAKELDQIHQFPQIFLACDEFETVELFKDTFGERLIVANAYRVSATTFTKSSYDWLFKASRPQHKYLLGKEVLIDALLLARAGHLLCGPSNVSHAAIYFADGHQIIHEVASPGFYYEL